MIKTFPSFSKDTSSYFIGLYEKYMSELETLSCILHNVFRRMKRKGYAVAFSDIEGEILYMLLREKRPGIVYEISPMHGCSTNYILAALTKNGVGRVEAFEIISRVGCTKIGDVIKSNLASLCDFTQYFLHVGDVRETLASQMTSLPPDFVFIDSCHEDYFAEFYVKELFLKCQGPIFIQDICYVDPRPEHNSEATFLLSLLNGNFISIGQYENEINTSVDRSRLVARRPHRSSSILIENPLYEKHGINEYFWLMKSRIWKSHLSTKLLYGGHFTFLELTAMQRGEISLAPALLSNMRRTFLDYDPWSQALLLKFVPDMENVIPKDKIFGPEIPLRVAEITKKPEWIEMAREMLKDTSVCSGYSRLIRCALIYVSIGKRKLAQETFKDALNLVKNRDDLVMSKVSRIIYGYMVRYPVFIARLWDAVWILDNRQIVAVFYGMFLSLARRLIRRI